MDNMLCAPQVLQQLVDALRSNAGATDLTRIVLQDPVLSVHVYVAAGGEGLQQDFATCIARVSVDQLRALVFRLGIRQSLALDQFEQYAAQYTVFWQRALRSAMLARELAVACDYLCPDEAYLAGLLSSIGQIAGIGVDGDSYPPGLTATKQVENLCAVGQLMCAGQHSALSAELVANWGFSTFFSDAVRFQHEPATALQDTHHLVKIVHLSNVFVSVDNRVGEELLLAAQDLLGLDVGVVQALITRSDEAYTRIAGALELTDVQRCVAVQHTLGLRLAELGELAQIKIGQLQASSSAAAFGVLEQWLASSLGISRVVFFKYDVGSEQLVSDSQGVIGSTDLRIALAPGRSLVSDSFIDNKPVLGRNKGPSTVIDRQLLHFLQGDYLQCWPLCSGQKKLGMLVYAITHEACAQTEKNNLMLADIAMLAADNFHHKILSNDSIDAQALASGFQAQIREAVHETSNPLSIVRNYLEMVRLKLGGNNDVKGSLELVDGEITRVAEILTQLRDGAMVMPDTQGIADVNRLISDSVTIIRDSIGVAKNLTFDLQLGRNLVWVPVSVNSLKQVMMNLLKNAVEAQRDGGSIRVRSDGGANFNGRRCIAISVADNGPGLPEDVMASVFHGGITTKGSRHDGLGLGIVLNLVDSMGGDILCRTNEHGTEFEIFLPMTDPVTNRAAVQF